MSGLKTHFSGFFTKSNSSEQNICRNRRLKINFQRYVVVQAKTKHERSRQTQY